MKPAASSEARSLQFRWRREASWRELEKLVSRVEREGLRTLGEADLVALPRLHRAAVSSLSVARAISLDRNLLEYLEGLTARSHVCVYGVRRRLGPVAREFFARRFPRAVRGAWIALALSSSLLVGGVAAGFALTRADLDRFHAFVPGWLGQGHDPSSDADELRQVLYGGEEHGAGGLAVFASFLLDNNSRVGILSFALGIAAGLPVFFLMFTTGLSLGAMAALYDARGLSLDFWGWVLPHGVTELLAIVLCGAAGLQLGAAWLFPGRRARLENLARVGRGAGLVVVGAVAMFVFAAMIEGFFRQLVHSVPVRYAVAASTALFWLVYFVFAGRGTGASEEPALR